MKFSLFLFDVGDSSTWKIAGFAAFENMGLWIFSFSFKMLI